MRLLLIAIMVATIGGGASFILSNGSGAAPTPTPAPAPATGLLDELGTRLSGDANDEQGDPAEPGFLERWLGGNAKGAPAPGTSVYFQYVDESGSVHFVQSLEQVPAAQRDNAGRIELKKRPPTRTAARSERKSAGRPAAGKPTSGKPGRRPFSGLLSPSEPTRRASADVVIYTTKWCGWCRKTIAWLDREGVDYENRDIEADDRYRSELIQKTGRTSIPVVEIDGELVRGYNPDRMEKLLGS